MKIQLKRSNVLDGGKAKEPTPSQMEYGELAVNYNTNDPTIFIKDSNNQIIRISTPGLPDLNINGEQPGTIDERYVLNTGDTMTGTLVLNADPVQDLDAATKQYVDNEIENLIPGTVTSPTPPDPAVVGQLWWNTIDGSLYIYYQDVDSTQWVPASPNTGNSITIENLETTKAKFKGQLSENVTISGSAANAGVPIDLEKGNVHYFTSASNAQYQLNIRYNATDTLNDNLEIGETVSVTILSKNTNSTIYLTGIQIDGAAQTILWSNGEAPAEGGSGVDSFTFQIIKTAAATFTVLGSSNTFA